MNAPGTAQGKHTGEASELYMAFELGEKNWKLLLSDGARSPSRYTVAAGARAHRAHQSDSCTARARVSATGSLSTATAATRFGVCSSRE
jgi:transposase